MRSAPLLIAALGLSLGVACTTLSSITGARTLEPGQLRLGVSPSLQRGGNPVSVGTLPLPQAEAFARVGVAEHVDVGVRIYLVGAAVDVRYRFLQRDRLHLAIAPGIGGTWVPLYGGAASGQGSVEMRAPLMAEVELNDWSSVMGGPSVVMRRQRNTVDSELLADARLTRLDTFVGGGLRYEVRPGDSLIIGASADMYGQTARHAGLAWSAGVDLAIQSKPGRIKALSR